MSYQKPQILAKSDAKQSYTAGCPVNTYVYSGCHYSNSSCMNGSLD